ncbi:MarR family transcriptional regulator [Gordonia sp. CPCC 205515]|uniref:MarR family winged helix-turn-helix transcriptional regulator n=1 Tax=Gordonia sp. CPCC 205515 TaxID=3140791 RepID=UPI003AF3B7A9
MSEGSDQPLTAAQRQVWSVFVDGGWALLATVNAELSNRGLAQTDLRVLEALAGVSQRGISELAGDVHMTISTVSRQIARLIESGAVERVPSDADGRHRLVRVTDAGYELLHAHVAVRDEMIRKLVVDVLTDDEYATIGVAFGKIRDAVAARQCAMRR